MLVDILLFVLGLLILYFGAEFLVKGSSALALRFGITPLIVGCTVVAFGTSAPELVVSLIAVLGENDDISVGNIIGSNVANLALILGAAAVIKPIEVSTAVIRREYPIMLVASLIFMGLIFWDGRVSRTDGFILLFLMAAYIGYMIIMARRGMADIDDDEMGDPKASSNVKDILRVIGGIIGLAGGAQLMVGSAISIAEVFGIPHIVIGISIIAIGTSLPELATSMVAIYRDAADISVGNVIGSNVFNILLVLGIIASLAPLKVSDAVMRWDIWIMIGVTIAIWPIMATGKRIGRIEGALLLLFYVAYMVWLFMRAG